ncbi:MAG: DUF2089 family protein [Planctomycetes bacterium]|nr:DUF2089 family protein [Planctomycetota bacterium]
MQRENGSRWIDMLGDEDQAFLKRFLMASGSLKALAQVYGVSYPTIRLRLDRLIEKVKILDSQTVQSEFERRLRVLHADGKIDIETMKALLAVHRSELEGRHETHSSAD